LWKPHSYPPPLPAELLANESRPQLGSLLLRDGILSVEQLEWALAEKEANGKRLGEIVVEHGLVSGSMLAQALAEQHALADLDLARADLDPAAVGLLPEKLARRLEALPVRFVADDVVQVAVADPTEDDAPLDFGVIDDLRDGSATGAPAIKLANQLIARAIEDGASDLHFEPQQDRMLVRARIDGVMREFAQVPKGLVPAVTSRLKIMGELDIADRRSPRTAGSRSATAARRSTSGSQSSPRPTGSRSCSGSSTAPPAGSASPSSG